MFSFLVANYPPCWPHSNLWDNDDDCHNLKCLCHFTRLIGYIACWTIILECKISEKLIQHGNGWCSFQGAILVINPSITDSGRIIWYQEYHECVDHSRYVWIAFLVDTILIKIDWMRHLSVRNMASTVVK